MKVLHIDDGAICSTEAPNYNTTLTMVIYNQCYSTFNVIIPIHEHMRQYIVAYHNHNMEDYIMIIDMMIVLHIAKLLEICTAWNFL